MFPQKKCRCDDRSYIDLTANLANEFLRTNRTWAFNLHYKHCKKQKQLIWASYKVLLIFYTHIWTHKHKTETETKR